MTNPFLESEKEFLLNCMNNDFEKIKETRDIKFFDPLVIIDAIGIVVSKNYRNIFVWLSTESEDKERIANIIFFGYNKWEKVVGRFIEENRK